MPSRSSILTLLLALIVGALTGCLAPRGEEDAHAHSSAHDDHGAAVDTYVVRQQAAANCNERPDVGYVRGNPYQIKLIEIDGKPVEKDTGNAYWVMQQEAARAGVQLRIVSGFRTNAQQQYLYNCYRNCNCNNCNLAARPGYSNHQSGHALDLNTSSAGVYNWLTANAGRFGFKRTVPSEKWHWEWWGGGPGGGICGVCEPSCVDNTTIKDANCNTGNCAAFGARCVDDNLGARCAFFACPDQGELDVCIDEKTIGHCNNGTLESTGDCSAFFAVCSKPENLPTKCRALYCVSTPDEAPVAKQGCDLGGNIYSCDASGDITLQECPDGQKCSVYPELGCVAQNGCPASGQAEVCVDEHLIGKCFNGGLHEIAMDCSNQNAYCSTAGSDAPRCHSVHCVSDANQAPSAHDICLPSGDIGHCSAEGTITTEVCPDGTTCSTADGEVRCVEGDPPMGGEDMGNGADMGGADQEMPTGNNGTPEPAPNNTSPAPMTGETTPSAPTTTTTTTGQGRCEAAPARVGGEVSGWFMLLMLAGVCRRRKRRR